MAGPDPAFWENFYARGGMPWDRGEPSPAIARMLAQGVLQPGMTVVVPGCGSGYELPALARAGLHVIGLDYAQAAVQRAHALVAGLGPEEATRIRIEQADVLQWVPSRPVDVVYEQTCLCALHPDHWVDYAERLRAWMVPEGTLIAQFEQVLRSGAAEGRIEGPPYHGDINAMRALFTSRHWHWPKPPYPKVEPEAGLGALLVVLRLKS